MMDFKQLQQLQPHLSRRQQKLATQAEKTLFNGMHLLEKAHQQKFRNKDTIKSACTALIESIQHHRSDIRPYLFLCYLFTILEAFDTALEYLQGASEIDPQHPIVAAFSSALSTQRKNHAQTTKIVGLPDLSHKDIQDLNIDSLFEQVETFVISELRHQMQKPPPVPTIDTQHFQELQEDTQKLREMLEILEKNLELLATEIDITHLRTEIKPLKIIHKRHENALSTSQELRALYIRINGQITNINQLIIETRNTKDIEDIPILEENLEALMDNCDQFADELDHMIEIKYPTALVEERYNILVQVIENYHDMMDDTISRLTHPHEACSRWHNI